MSEVLARTRHDSVLSGVSEGALRHRVRRGLIWLQRLRGVLPNGADGYAGIAMAFAMTVIVVNALIMQRERHPAPFFIENASTSAASTRLPNEQIVPLAASEGRTLPRAMPPSGPSDAHPEPNSSSRPMDPIAEMLHSEANKDTQHLLIAAQTALTKLGYSIRAGAAARRGYNRRLA